MSPSKTARAKRWADVVRVRARYQRSVHLERDASEPEWLKGYIITPLVRSLVGRIAGGLEAGGTARAWSLTGPYGSGKSAFVLFLGHLLGVPTTKQAQVARQLLADADPDLAERLLGRDGVLPKGDGLWPVLATGERRSLDQVLLCALRDSAMRFWSGRGVKPDVFNRLVKATKRAESGQTISSKEVVGFYEEVAEKVAQSAMLGRGLLIVLDEAGKILEYASQTSVRSDVVLLQELAEACARSGETPMILVLTLHQSFERYATRLGVAQRSEWAKVQGRFEDVAFQEATDQVLRLIAAALERGALPADAKAVASNAAKEIGSLVRLPGAMKSHEFEKLLLDTLPLHPATALLLGPLFRSRLGQNERSLFAFLATTEPGGFQEFLRAAPASRRSWDLFTIDQLYSYVTSSLGTRLYEHQGRQWSQIETALRRLPEDSDALDARIVKAVGLLGLFGEAAGLTASEQALIACLDAHRPAEQQAVRDGLARLQAASILVFRRYKNAYQLWEGSDLDLDSLVARALREVDQYTAITQRIARAGSIAPIIARRHLFETGTLRYFEIRYADETMLDRGLVNEDTEADGTIWLLLPRNAPAEQAVRVRLAQPMTWVTENAQAAPSIVALPDEAERLRQLALEVSALEWVQVHTPELQSDAAARRELAARLSEAERVLRQELHRVLMGSAPCSWYFRGRVLGFGTARELARAISDICDEVFSKAPAIHNELLNRRTLIRS